MFLGLFFPSGVNYTINDCVESKLKNIYQNTHLQMPEVVLAISELG